MGLKAYVRCQRRLAKGLMGRSPIVKIRVNAGKTTDLGILTIGVDAVKPN